MTSSVAIIPDALRLQEQATVWPLQAAELSIVSQGTLDRAGELLSDIKALRQEIAGSCDPVIHAAHKSHKAAVNQKKELEAPLVEAEGMIKKKIGTFTDEQRRLRQQEEARLEAERRKAEEEKLAEAQALSEMGEPELAEAVLEEAEEEPPPPAPAPIPKAKGAVTRELWKAEVKDMKALVAAVAAGQVPLAVLKVDQAVLTSQARSLKGELQWPGVKVWSETNVASR